MSTPFIIYALPRSRTAWLATFLSYKEWECYHELAIFMRSMDEVKDFFSNSNVGCVETAAAQGRHLIRSIVPNIKEVVILRSPDEVVDSLMNIDLTGVATYDRKLLQRNMEYGDRILRKIATEKNVLSINYNDLENEETCAKIFEHCLPYSFDRAWWESLKDRNIQVDVRAFFRYYYKNREAIEVFKKHCKSELRRLFKAGKIERAKHA